MINPEQVSARIDLIRRKNDLTQEQLASLLGLSQPAVSKYLRRRLPPAEALLKIAQLGQTTIEWLLTGRKNYFYMEETDQVNEPEAGYDAEYDLTRKVAALPTEIRAALHVLIDELVKG